MKLKILGICSIAALLYGEDVFATVMDMAKQYEFDLRNSRKDQNPDREKRTEEMGRLTKSVNVGDLRKNFERSDSQWDQSPDRKVRMDELKESTESVSVGDLRKNFERPDLKRSLSLSDIEKVKDPEVEEINVSGGPSRAQIDESNENRASISDVSSGAQIDRFDEKNVIVDDKSRKSTHSFGLIKEFNERVENGLSRLARNIEGFKKNVSFYMQEEQRMTQKELVNMAENLNESKENLISTLDENIANFEYLQKMLQDLKIDEKIEWLKARYQEIESLLENVKIEELKSQMNKNKENRLSRKERRRQQRQEAAQKRQVTEQNRRASYKTGPIDWDAINEYYNKNLSKFAKAARLHKFRHNVVMKYGKKCLEDQDGSLFDPGQKMDSSLKGLCAQIYEVRFPEAIAVWSEIKNMDNKDPNYEAKLEELRSKVELLGRNVDSLIKQKTDLSRVSRVKEAKDQTQNVDVSSRVKRYERMEDVKNETQDVSVASRVKRYERMKDVKNETQDVNVASQVGRYERMEDVKNETQNVNVSARVKQRKRMKDVRDQTRNVNVKKQGKKLGRQGQSKTDQLFK